MSDYAFVVISICLLHLYVHITSAPVRNNLFLCCVVVAQNFAPLHGNTVRDELLFPEVGTLELKTAISWQTTTLADLLHQHLPSPLQIPLCSYWKSIKVLHLSICLAGTNSKEC